MKKNLLAIGLMLAGITAVAQTPRLSLYEEFTGENCPPCASTNPALNVLLASPTNTPKIVAIKWQVPIPSAPSATWSLYQTNKIEIDWRWMSSGYGYIPAINSAPHGRIDGQVQTNFGATSGHPVTMNNTVIGTAQSFTSAFSVTMNRAWDATFSAVNLTINITASANFNAIGNLVFRTVMVEKETHFVTAPGTNGEKDFEDVAIKSFPTLQAGVSMVPTWTVGQTQTFTLNCPVPSYCRDKAEVAFVGFIQDDGDKKVAQSVRADKQTLANDAKAVSVAIPFSCTNTATPIITIKNNGSNAITGFVITPITNGVPGTVYNWSGNLAVGASTTFPINSVNVITGTNIYSYQITSVVGTDNNLLNNSADTKFVGVVSYQGNPVAEGFSTSFPPANWSTYNATNGATWIKTTACGGYGLSSEATKLDFYNTISNGTINDLMLPPITFTGASAPTLKFDVAHSQYATENDKLEVKVSTNCGSTWTTVFTKSGANLSTTGVVQTSAFTPNATQWRTETVALTGVSGNVLVKFVGTSAYGNNLYLDNINLKQCKTHTITATKNKICKGQSVVITASGASTYSWSNNTAGGSTISVSPTITTTYSASSTDNNNCGETAAFMITVDACVGLNSIITNLGNVFLFPNPTNGNTNLNIELTEKELISISVLNAIGQEVYSLPSNTMNVGANTVSLNTETWATGVYFVKISTPNGFVNQKLTVSK
jgi:hypothetical protein